MDAAASVAAASMAFNLLVEFFDIFMLRKCLLGLQRRAEAMPR